MNRRPWTLIVIAFLVVAIAGYLAWQRLGAGAARTAIPQTAQVERGTLVAAVNGAGNMVSPQTATLTWQAGGVVGRVSVSVGEVVEAGSVLVELDPDRADPAQLQAQADLLGTQASLEALLAGPTEQQLAQARLAVVQAQQAITTAQRSLNSVLNPVSQALLDQVQDAKVAADTAAANLQLTNVDPDVAALQNQVFLTNWYLNRLNQIKEESQGFENNPDIRDKIERAQIDYQAQLDKQYALQLQIDTDRNTKANAARNAQAAYDQALANLQAAQRGPNAAQVALLAAELEVARANLAQAEADLAELQAGPDPQAVAAARAKVAAAQAIVDSARLEAPFRGTVVAVHAQAGDEVSAGQPAVELADLSRLEIEVNVAEVDINRIAVGQTASLTVDAAPDQTFSGQVSAIAFLGTSQQGVVNFPVTVVITDPDPALKPGMTAAVAIVTERHADVLLVPNRAIRVSGGQRIVTVLFEGQQIPVPVTVGLSNETQSEILEGALQAGDSVVISTASTTAAGQAGGAFFLPGPGGGAGRLGP